MSHTQGVNNKIPAGITLLKSNVVHESSKKAAK